MQSVKKKNIHVDLTVAEKPYNCVQDVNRMVRYIVNPVKTPSGLIGARGVTPYDSKQMCKEFSMVRKAYEKKYGRLAKQVIVSVDRQYEVEPKQLLDCAKALAKKQFPDNQCVYAVHENHDANNLHVHIAINAINYKTGRKLDFDTVDINKMRKAANDFINGKDMAAEEDYNIMDLL